MLSYLLRRVLLMSITVLAISVMAFVIIQLPPGDYLSTVIHNLQARGVPVNQEMIRSLENQYGLDLPLHAQYLKWLWNLLHGDFGRSFQWNEPVSKLIGERLLLTVLISTLTLILSYLVAVPIGIYSATHQYSFFDYGFSALGFIGLATPNFLLALVLMYLFNRFFGLSAGGLFSTAYQFAPWSIGKVLDLLAHLPARRAGDQCRPAADQERRLNLRVRRDRPGHGAPGQAQRPLQFQPPGPPVADARPGVRRPGAAVRLDRAGAPRLPALRVGGVPGGRDRPGNRPPRHPRGQQDLSQVLMRSAVESS